MSYLRKLIVVYPLTILALVTLGFLYPLSLLLSPLGNKSRHFVLHQAWRIYSYILIHLAFLARVHKQDNRTEKNFHPKGLVISNHMSMGDIPLLHTAIASYPLMKKEILSYPCIGFITKASGAIAVDRKDPSSRKSAFRKLVKLMQSGEAVNYYPEGTRSKELRPKPVEKIHQPLLAMAYKSQVPVYPISLYGTHLLYGQKSFRPFLKLGLILHKEVLPGDFATQEAFIHYCWEQVCSGFDVLREHIKAERS